MIIFLYELQNCLIYDEIVSHHQNSGQNHKIKIDNRSLEKLANSGCLGMTVTNQNLIHEGIRGRFNKG
jgi:hypothetical protein